MSREQISKKQLSYKLDLYIVINVELCGVFLDIFAAVCDLMFPSS